MYCREDSPEAVATIGAERSVPFQKRFSRVSLGVPMPGVNQPAVEATATRTSKLWSQTAQG